MSGSPWPKVIAKQWRKTTKLLRSTQYPIGGDDLCWTFSPISKLRMQIFSAEDFFSQKRLFHLGVFVVRVHEDWKLTSTPLNLGHWAALRNQGGHTPPLLLDNQTSGLLMVQKSQGQPPGISKNPGDSWDFNYRSLNWWSPSTKQQIHKSRFSRRKTNGQNKRKNKTPSFFLKKAEGSLVKIKSLDLSNHLAAIPKHMTSWCLLVCFIRKPFRFHPFSISEGIFFFWAAISTLVSLCVRLPDPKEHPINCTSQTSKENLVLDIHIDLVKQRSMIFHVEKKSWKFAWLPYSRKRPRRVPSKIALPLKTVIKDCHQTSPKVKTLIKIAQSSTDVMAVFQDCHETSPKVLLMWWLSLKIVIKHRPKFYWCDGCL